MGTQCTRGGYTEWVALLRRRKGNQGLKKASQTPSCLLPGPEVYPGTFCTRPHKVHLRLQTEEFWSQAHLTDKCGEEKVRRWGLLRACGLHSCGLLEQSQCWRFTWRGKDLRALPCCKLVLGPWYHQLQQALTSCSVPRSPLRSTKACVSPT